MNRNLVFAALASALSGCAQVTTVPATKAFNAAEAEQAMRPGHNIIDGSALIRQNGGGVVTCAGQEVQLTPATDYANERMVIRYESMQQGYWPIGAPNIINPPRVPEEPDPRYLRFGKTTTCDAQGKFQFADLADGSFYVTTTIIWNVGYNAQGGYLMKRVDLKGGSSIERIVLTP